MWENAATKCEGEKSSGYRGGFCGRNAHHQSPSSFTRSSIPKFQHTMFTCGHPGDVVKCETTKKSTEDYGVQTYDGSIVLSEGICVGKLPIPDLTPTTKKTKKSKSKLAGSEFST